MNNAEFTKLLDAEGYSYTVKDGAVVVTHNGDVSLHDATSIPAGVAFKNGGLVSLNAATSIPNGVVFENSGGVYLYAATSISAGVAFKNGGDVYLYAATSISADVAFENGGGVYLRAATSIPEGVAFENGGVVYLHDATSISAGVAFKNGGSVYLYAATRIGEGIVFENGGAVLIHVATSFPDVVVFRNRGGVAIRAATSTPKGVVFENGGMVILYAITGRHEYQGETRNFEQVNGYTMITGAAKTVAGYTVKPARYMKGGAFEDMPKCYVAYGGGETAHGKTVKDAIDDLQFKLAKTADKLAVVKEIAETQLVTLAQFRALTGACRDWIRHHLSDFGIDADQVDSLPLDRALEVMAGTSFGDTFQKLLEKE